MYEENNKEFAKGWVASGGWKDATVELPRANAIVIIFYIDEHFDYVAELVHEQVISLIDSPIMYWIEKPE